MDTVRTTANSNPKLLLRFLTGGTLGAAVGYAAIELALKLQVSPKSFSLFDCVALWLGVVYIAFAIVVFFISANRRRLARTIEGDEATLPATTGEVRSFRIQAVTLGLAGIMILVPPFASGSLAAHRMDNPTASLIVFGVIVLLFAAQTAANIHLWRISDEFTRGIMLTVAAVTFAIGQGLLFLYAAAERMHLVHEVSSWDVITLVLTLYLFVTTTISLRHQR